MLTRLNTEKAYFELRQLGKSSTEGSHEQIEGRGRYRVRITL